MLVLILIVFGMANKCRIYVFDSLNCMLNPKNIGVKELKTDHIYPCHLIL